MNQKVYLEPNRKATLFEFVSYTFEPEKKQVVFHYKTEFEGKEPLFFTETILLPKVPDLEKIPKEVIDKLLQSLHIILGISYYKFYCPPLIKFGNGGEVSPKLYAKADATKVALPYALSKPEADFWNTVYKKGLGEFFYKNNLDPKILPKFPYRVTNTPQPVTHNLRVTGYGLRVTNKCLVGIGGGKDSIVVAELLKEHGFDATAFHIETQKESRLVNDVIKISGLKDLKIQRLLDWQVHQKHLYNGHIPVSAIYAFLGILSAVFYDYSHVIVGNEHSSNFGNIKYKGLEVNHQWSKSLEFEQLFQNYVKSFITPDVTYFSLLRPFYEIRIVKLFSKYKQYFPYFSSCNQNFKITGKNHAGLWCGQCAKCVFVFTLLSAFLSKKELITMFGKNLYEDESLLTLFKDVLGFGAMKPFDCVGTFEEAQTALFLAKKNFGNDFIVRQFGERAKLSLEVFATNKNSLVPEQFKFLGMERAYILGYGKEGKVTKKYLQKYYPNIKTKVGDSALDKKYLEKQSNFDIAIKTPGIKKELITIPYTTATNMFFSHLRQGFGGQAKVIGKNLIIGVTGSKGKSTTSSLIYRILKTAGKDAQLLGNIGAPMLEALLKPTPKNRIFVLELSSYQLDDIKFSPDIAVATNLFPEHMDFHGSLKNYYNAKKNIINFQNKNNYFVYNQKSAGWLKDYKGKAVPFFKKVFKSNLLGQHNEQNIAAAAAAANILGILEKTIAKAVKSFKGLPHRLENVGTFKAITFYDDAISTTPDSTIMAIKALQGTSLRPTSPKIGTIFLGGQDRGYNFIQLEKAIKQYRIKNIVLFPDSGPKILRNKKDLNILKTKSMKEAVAFAYQYTKKGEICLLSCASPSYSLWKNFEQKGQQFQKFIKQSQ